ncbi:MAG: hypothetical protein P4L60_17270 [Clostridium sp.]|nr:hypothetical protein [Clostridium sp.]
MILLNNYSSRVEKVLDKNVKLIKKRQVYNEQDWQSWLYVDFRDEFFNDRNIKVFLEVTIRIPKAGRNKLYKVDILILDKESRKPAVIIELKYKSNLKESELNKDILKMKEIRSLIENSCLLYSVGFNSDQGKLFLHNVNDEVV